MAFFPFSAKVRNRERERSTKFEAKLPLFSQIWSKQCANQNQYNTTKINKVSNCIDFHVTQQHHSSAIRQEITGVFTLFNRNNDDRKWKTILLNFNHYRCIVMDVVFSICHTFVPNSVEIKQFPWRIRLRRIFISMQFEFQINSMWNHKLIVYDFRFGVLGLQLFLSIGKFHTEIKMTLINKINYIFIVPFVREWFKRPRGGAFVTENE